MLKIYDRDNTELLAFLGDAYNARYVHEINGDYLLYFSIPANGGAAQYVNRFNVVYCDYNGQYYRVSEITKKSDGAAVIDVTCLSLYHADEAKHCIRILENAMGVSAIAQFRTVFNYAGSPFTLLSDAQITALGMTPLTRFIDFWEMSKITPDEAVKTIIQSAGYGEIYIDNYKIALVESIGSKSVAAWVDTHANAQSITQNEVAETIVTRLIPYGKNDMPITSINGTDYIDSPNIPLYGVCERKKVYGNIDDVNMLLARAQFEFSPDNPERIDVPRFTIEGKIADLFKAGAGFQINLGDAVRVLDKQARIDQTERVIKIEVYPYDYTNSLLSKRHYKHRR